MARYLHDEVSQNLINILDGYYNELYENKEMKTVLEMSKELENVCASSIYHYIKYCTGNNKKKREFMHILMCTKFTSEKVSAYAKMQKALFEQIEKREKSKEVINELLKRQEEKRRGVK